MLFTLHVLGEAGKHLPCFVGQNSFVEVEQNACLENNPLRRSNSSYGIYICARPVVVHSFAFRIRQSYETEVLPWLHVIGNVHTCCRPKDLSDVDPMFRIV